MPIARAYDRRIVGAGSGDYDQGRKRESGANPELTRSGIGERKLYAAGVETVAAGTGRKAGKPQP